VGLVTLNLIPLPALPKGPAGSTPTKVRSGISAALGGLFLGGGVAACSLPCNPGIFIVLGASVLQGHTLWGMILMAAFAVGFSLPLSAILFGISFGKSSIKAGKVDAVIRAVAGVILVGAGFYLLVTF